MSHHRRRIRLARRAPTVADVFTPREANAYYQWRDAAEAALADRDLKPDNINRDAELEQWRAVWSTP